MPKKSDYVKASANRIAKDHSQTAPLNIWAAILRLTDRLAHIEQDIVDSGGTVAAPLEPETTVAPPVVPAAPAPAPAPTPAPAATAAPATPAPASAVVIADPMA